MGAYLAAYTEFVGGILLLLGLWTRWAALLLIINFCVAVSLGHLAIQDTYEHTFASVNLLAVNIFLFLNGAGNYSVDQRIGFT